MWSEQQLAAIVESSDDAIVAKDLQSVITSWNGGAERLFGYSAAEATGRPITMIIPPERWPEEDRVMASVRAGKRVEPFETVRVRKDGSSVHVSVTVSPIRDASGDIVGASKIARDITERVDARERLQFIADVSALLGSSLDYSQTLEQAVHLALPRLGDYCNVMLEDDHGVLKHVAAGHVDRAKEPIVRELAVRAIEQGGSPLPTFAERIVKTGRTHVVSPADLAHAASALDPATIDPRLFELGLTLQPYAYAGAPLLVLGRPVGVISFGMTATGQRREFSADDVTLLEEFARRVSLAMENARLYRQTQELNRLKDEFLATLSHEMRTPLSAILGWARILAQNPGDEARTKHAIDVIVRNAQAQAQIVDDVLDVARGMAGNLRLDMKPIDLVSIAERGVDAVAPAASAKKIPIEISAPGPVPIVGDAGRLQQIAWNLLSNAVKFTPAGGQVRVAVGAHDGHAELRVTDTGSGISREFMPFVFDKFRQADGSVSRQHGGLGLGLAIARHLAEMHGGSIDAHSEGEGRGATFVVRLPLRAES
ncbi:MAG TPA: PAS domain-containing sensor histidine kinase [Vicinamibacterales bacterium]|nr:PAS domain-containing sensor histidine kinase [Vicinamibacterales bacterium]